MDEIKKDNKNPAGKLKYKKSGRSGGSLFAAEPALSAAEWAKGMGRYVEHKMRTL